jgi:hypothetical protein
VASVECASDCENEEVCCVHVILAPYDMGPVWNYYFYKIPRRMKYARHVARMGERRGLYRVLVRDLTERDNLRDPGINGIIILRWIFRKWEVGL